MNRICFDKFFLTTILFVVNVSISWGQTDIASLSDITDPAGSYRLTSDVSGSGHTSIETFSGTLEAAIDPNTKMPYRITGLKAPLFTTLTGTVKNLVLEGVNISDNTGNTGAIACTANSAARIYNIGILSGEVGGSDNTGGLVGLLDGTARVINCYSFADITSGTNVGGIVGYNNVTTNSDAANLKTMVMNCMFYGDLTGGTTKSPIYGGKIISNADNKGVGNYNYFRLEAPFVQPTGITYNCALGAEDRFLKRFEFYRLLLNSHRELAGWWATGTFSSSKMLKWVLETADRTIDNPKPYPVLKVQGRYPSIANYDAEHAPTLTLVNGKPREEDRNKGGKFGTLTVNIRMGDGAVYQRPSGAAITTSPLTLNITDKDPDRFNFNYYKVQLPYYNDVGTKNYNGNRVVTGWKIVSITGGTPGTFTASDTWGGYNFADRKCTNKDLYGTGGSNRIFNQGAYWDVPEGVTSITIEPYWAKCVYLADPNADKVYNTAMETGYDVANVGGGVIYTNGNSYSIAGENQVVYTSMGNAIASSGTALFSGVDANSHSVYDYAVVLVGNYHHFNSIEASKAKPYTVTSIDLDGDNEPDYSYILRFNGRTECHPVRADFINIPGFGMAQKSTGGTGSYNFGILIPKGWFESTNTSLFRVTQFEYENSARSATDALIVQGGVMEQWVSYNQKGRSNKIPYIHVGGNVWFKEFHTGCHQDKNQTSGGNRFQPTKHSPISVTGGDFDEFYLTGLYVANAGLDNYADNAECYINGGRFGTICGAAMEGIGKANGADNTGNISWLIQNADIREFYAGGLNAAKPVTGNLSTTIVDSHVDIFCGGPKFGDMSANKTVVTNATGCTFGTFFGAGYGGNSYSRYAPSNQNNVNNIKWNDWVTAQYTQSYNATYGGVSTRFVYQFLPMSDNKTNVARILVDFVKFSLATTRNVTSTLKGCTITNNFYGGGSLGKVDGSVTSTLDGCTVNGSAFGAGFSASLPTVEVDSIGFRVEPYYYDGLGTYRTGVKGVTTTYRWEHGNTISVDNGNHILYTTEDLTTLGTVTGKATLNITGNTIVEGKVFNEDGTVKEITGGVFGGGDASAALGDTEVNVDGGTSSSILNVFGGGNRADVSGNVTVNMRNGTVNQSVYGGGALANTNIGNVTAGYGTASETISSTSTKTTTVNLLGGTINGDAYGGGLGRIGVTATAGEKYTQEEIDAAQEGDPAYGKTTADWKVKPVEGVEAVKALVYGNVTVTQNGAAFVPATTTDDEDNTVVTAGRIFGCNNLNGSPMGTVLVLVNKTVRAGGGDHAKSVYDASGNLATNNYEMNAVYGGGNLAAYDPLAATLTATGQFTQYTNASNLTVTRELTNNPLQVVINGCSDVSIEYVYGGGNAAATPSTDVLVLGAFELGNVFGGGNGKDKTTTDNGATWGINPGADVGVIDQTAYQSDPTTGLYGSGNATTTVLGGKIHNVFGGSNKKGVIVGTMNVQAMSDTDCALSVDNMYGGGNEADSGSGVITIGCMSPGSGIGNVYGGANQANISGDITMNVVGGNIDNVFGGNDRAGTISGTITVNIIRSEVCEWNVNNVYGGGNLADYHAPASATHSPIVNIINGHVNRNVYGGGFKAKVYGNPLVNIWPQKRIGAGETSDINFDGLPEYTRAYADDDLISGDVFGGGDQADIIGNTEVRVFGGRVLGTIYGGGNLGSVGDFTDDDDNPIYSADASGNTVASGAPTKCVAGTGLCTVTIKGRAEIGPDGMQMTKEGGPDDAGHVFGASKGDVGDPATNSSIDYLAYVDRTEVTIEGEAFVKGSVYGGGMNGRVLHDTHVTIKDDCQIGNGDGINRRYTAAEWESENPASFKECAHWPYDANHNGEVYDPFAKYPQTVEGVTTYYYDEAHTQSSRGAAAVAAEFDASGNMTKDGVSDGRTFYGNVFGGGSGYFPYAPGKWLLSAGQVNGNSTVDILGGHILTSVYGGNELTDVKGTATINMVAGTVGVPRTDAQMKAHPVTCYVFGAGKGDPRAFFNTMTDVAHATVNVTGTARIFGSTFGGGEDGQVDGNAVTTIGDMRLTIGGVTTNYDGSGVIIGTTGTSGVDGNVFGAGRGYSALALTIGLIKGNVETNINNGKIYGSVFGGGRTASVGTHQVLADDPNYGKMLDCGWEEGETPVDDPRTKIDERQHNHGHVFVNIYGNAEIGRIDNTLKNERGDEGGMLAKTDVTLATGEKHPSIGDVFGGGKGMALHDNQELSRMYGWVKNSSVKIYGNAKVNGSVYGGGEISCVGNPDEPTPTGSNNWKTGFSEVSIYGEATIGTQNNSYGEHGKGYVYGSGKGLAGSHYSEEAFVKNTAVTIGAKDSLLTSVTESDNPRVWGSVFGGGEDGHVRKDARVYIRKGTIGSPLVGYNKIATDPVQNETYDEWWFDPEDGASKVTVYRGNVYAGGRGIDKDDDDGLDFSMTAGAVYGNAKVEMTDGHVYHNIYGSGAMASVGTAKDASNKLDYDKGTWDTTTGHVYVTVTGGIVGDDTEGRQGRNNGRVFGAGRGLAANIEMEATQMEYVYKTKVTIGGTAQVLGAVFGGGENGHVKTDAEVNIGGNCIIGSPLLLDECLVTAQGAKGNAFRGNVFGGGRGVDATGANHSHRSFTAGRVYGNTTVNVSGGLIYRAVYGGGMLASVGNPTPSDTKITPTGTGVGDEDKYFEIKEWPFDEANPNGVATVNITGGYIGNVSDSDQPLTNTSTITYGEPGRNNGAVFGSGAGFMATDGQSEQYKWLAYVYRSYVNISDEATGPDAKHTHIRAAVFGGGENGHVWEDATVNVSGGTIGNAADGSNGGDFQFAGNVFGSGRGMNVTVTNGEDIVSTTAGLVKGNTTVNIWTPEGKTAPVICRDVYGGGNLGSVGEADKATTGLTTVNILGGDIYGNVYGASRGGASIEHEYQDMSYVKNTEVTITGTANIHAYQHKKDDGSDGGENELGGHVYGGGNAGHVRRNTDVVVGGEKSITAKTGLTTTIPVSASAGGTVGSSLFGAGRGDEVSLTAGLVNHDVKVTVKDGALIQGDVYGGGAIGNSNCHDERNTDAITGAPSTEADVICTTKVDLLGGIILGDAYGGGKGKVYKESDYNFTVAPYSTLSADRLAEVKKAIEENCAALVHGNVTVTLNGTAFKPAYLDTPTNDDEAHSKIPSAGRIFGCNNLNGTPKGTVLVDVKKTVGVTETTTGGVTTYTVNTTKPDKGTNTYEVQAVYGGGNLAACEPVNASAAGQLTQYKIGTNTVSHDATGKPVQVLIDGCDLTSIEYVYGGGNAAAVPASDVVILGTYEVDYAFGGGNGKDALPNGDPNPGAHVGLMAYPNTAGDAYSTKEERAANYGYGTGKAHVIVYGGTVHEVYGGSNTKGNVRVEARATLEDQEQCDFNLDEAYGGGRNAEMDGDAVLEVGCIKGLGRVYGGAANADVNGDVVLNITNGTYGQVFGGNDMGGNISGSIIVNIEETGCRPIIIGELYGGGNEAAYTAPTGGNYPVVNIKSFTSIGTVFGGGYGEAAVITGNPEVNINVVTGKYRNTVVADGAMVVGSSVKNPGDSGYDASTGFSIPAHQAGTIGNIGTVFGGGNAARVVGNTNVNVGTHVDEEVYDVVTVATGASVTSYYTRSGDTYTAATGTAVDGTTYYEKKKVAVRIVGNVFGGGNKAEVTGNTNVIVGK